MMRAHEDRQRSGGCGLVLAITADQLRRATAAGPGSRRRRWIVPRPHRCARHIPGSASQPERGDAGTQLRVCAISGIHQEDAPRKACLACGDELVESEHGLGLEDDVFRNASFLPARGIVGPAAD